MKHYDLLVLLLVAVHEHFQSLRLNGQTFIQAAPDMEENAQLVDFEQVILCAIPTSDTRRNARTSLDIGE